MSDSSRLSHYKYFIMFLINEIYVSDKKGLKTILSNNNKIKGREKIE
ncbi:hypothetical protein Mfun01_11350 [Megamonas funiformis]|nr:hypothetical protein Mfun01_11350 [Megamonas funiformis]